MRLCAIWVWRSGYEASVQSGYGCLGMRLSAIWVWRSGYEASVQSGYGSLGMVTALLHRIVLE